METTRQQSGARPTRDGRAQTGQAQDGRKRQTYRTSDRNCDHCGRSVLDHEQGVYCPAPSEG